MEKQRVAISRKSLSAGDVEAIYGVPRGTLANLRSRREGAVFHRVGKKIYYKIDDFERWFVAEPVLTKDVVRC